MAEKKLTLDLEINKGNSDKTAKSIKQELKEAREEAFALARKFGELSPEAIGAAKKLANLKDEMEDLNKSVQGLNPDKFARLSELTNGVVRGFQAAQGAAVLFGKTGEDIEKSLAKLQATMALADGVQGVLDARKQFGALASEIKGNVVKAFSTLKGAIIATGIGALVVVLGLVIANFDKVKKAVLNLVPGLATIAKYIGSLINQFTDFIGVTTESGRALEKSIEKQTSALEKLNGYLDRNLDKYNKYTQAKLQADADYKADKLKLDQQLNEGLDQLTYKQHLKELQDKRNRFIERADQDRAMEAKAAADKLTAERKSAAEKREQDRQERLKDRLSESKNLDDSAKLKADKGIEDANRAIAIKEAETRDLNNFNNQQITDLEERNKKVEAYNAEYYKKKEAKEKQYQDNIKALQIQGATAVFDLLNVLNQQNQNATEEQQKKAFNRNKGLQIAETTMSTYSAAQSAYQSQMTIPSPDAPIRAAIAAGIAITSGLARVIAISKTQFNGSGSPVGNSGGGGVGRQAASTGFSVVTKPSNPNMPTNSSIKPDPIKVFVVQKDLDKSKKQSDAIKVKSTVK